MEIDGCGQQKQSAREEEGEMNTTEKKKGSAQDKTPLFDAIMAYNRRRPAYFRIPGHRFQRGINQRWREVVGDEIFKFDLTETPYTDDLHNAEGAIAQAQDLAAQVFHAEQTYFLVNGTTCGNQAMVLTAALEGQTVAIARNAHKSALMGLIMSGAKPLYIMPQLHRQWGLHGGVTPEEVERLFSAHPECRGLMVVSPTYYGICSDIRGIAEVCHRHGAILMVDEAHGAHCYFSQELPEGALSQGADMASQSIHKVTGSLTQSSMLHLRSSLVDRARLRANLHMVQSTSPSYLLLTSLDMARHDLAMRGPEMIAEAVKLAQEARKRINEIEGIRCAGRELIGTAGIAALDETRLTISAAALGIEGFRLEQLLFEEYGCDVELSDYKNVLAIVTFANEAQELDRLVDALADISRRHAGGKPLADGAPLPAHPPAVMTPRQAYFAESEAVDWQRAQGRISAEMIAPYPPGIPLVYPGEQITEPVFRFLEEYRQRDGHLQGPADPTLATCRVICKQ